jgi:hypothetical protein
LNVDRTITPTFLIHAGVGEIRYWHIDAQPELTRTFDAQGKLGLVGALYSPGGFPQITGLNSAQGGIVNSMGWSINTATRRWPRATCWR